MLSLEHLPKKDGKTSFDGKTNANTFKECFCNLASDLVAKLPPLSNDFGISSVHNYYQYMYVRSPS